MILLVEDNIPLAEEAMQRLPLGIKIEYLTSAEEAADYLSHHDVDLLITDIHLPGWSGVKLIKTIREEGLDINIACLSADRRLSVLLDLDALGVRAYDKPIMPEDYCELLLEIIERETK